MYYLDFKNQKRYVTGFIFHASRVLLIVKERPENQKGKLNGVGGRIELGETPVQAMVREAREEACFESTKDDWLQFHYERKMYLTPGEVPSTKILYFYACTATKGQMSKVRSGTDEVIDLYSYERDSRLWSYPMLHNLPWLIPMARDYIENPEHRYMEG